MEEVAEAASGAGALVILPTPRLSEVSHGRVLGGEHAACEEASMESLLAGLGVLLVGVLDVHIAHHVVAQILAYLHLLQLTLSCQLLEYLLIVDVEVLLELALVHLARVAAHGRDGRERIQPPVEDDHCLAEGRLVVHPRTSFTVYVFKSKIQCKEG